VADHEPRPYPPGPQRESSQSQPSGLVAVLGLISQYGWATVIAVLFLLMYLGWLPDPRRTAAEKLVGEVVERMDDVRTEMRRVNERQIRMFSMLTELCLAAQRHDGKSVASCSYVYSNHQIPRGGD
jgi:hypothetical protein